MKNLPTPDDLVREVRAVAAERPDFVYRPPSDSICLYVNPDGSPGCIIGTALIRKGVDPAELAELDAHEGWGVGKIYGDIDLSSLAVDWLQSVQSCQDAGYRWASAVDDADDMYGNDGIPGYNGAQATTLDKGAL